jgi:putative serine protease PepD
LGLAAVLALMLGAGTGGAAIALALDDDSSAPSAPTSLDVPAASSSSGSENSPPEGLARVAAAVLPSVVSITTDEGQGTVQGSGVIISEDGRILTNNHVVADAASGAGQLKVTFSNGDTKDARIVGRDPATDLAVIQAEDASGLHPATLGSSSDLHVGDTVLAIGSPLGLNGSVTSGIVSALDRSITLGGEEGSSPFGNPGNQTTASINAIQTDAAINPGNSGGPLINANGQVIGINTAIASASGLGGGLSGQSGNIGVGFAIPIDDARDVAQQLIRDGEVRHAYLGVEIADADAGGALVGGVESNSPADDAGLRQGDVITKVDDTDITNSASLTAAIRSHEPGDQVTVTYTRGGDEHTARVRLATLPDQ